MKFLNKSNVLSFLAGLAASAAVCAVVIGVDVASDTATQDQTDESAEAPVTPSEGSFEPAEQENAPAEIDTIKPASADDNEEGTEPSSATTGDQDQ